MKLKRWRYRHRVFKLGFCGVLLSLVLFCIGYVSPAWQNTGGLWIQSQSVESFPDWFHAVQALETLCVLAVCVSVMAEVYQDVVRRSSPASDIPLVEFFSVLAGVSGLVGVVVFAVQAYSYPPGQGPFGPCRKPLFWAWGLQTAGSVIVLLSAALIGFSRAKNRTSSKRKMQVVAFRKTAPVGLNPYFVSRSAVPAVRIVPVVSVQSDSQA